MSAPRTHAALAALVLTLGLTACGGGSSSAGRSSAAAGPAGASAAEGNATGGGTRAAARRRSPARRPGAAAARARRRVRGRPARAAQPAACAATRRSCTCPTANRTRVDVISQRTFKVIDSFPVGSAAPARRRPSWDLRTLYVTNDLGNSLTPIDPRTGRPGQADPGGRPLQPVLHARRALGDRRRRGAPRARLPRPAHDGAAPRAARRRSAAASTTWTSRPTAATRSSRASSRAA